MRVNPGENTEKATLQRSFSGLIRIRNAENDVVSINYSVASQCVVVSVMQTILAGIIARQQACDPEGATDSGGSLIIRRPAPETPARSVVAVPV